MEFKCDKCIFLKKKFLYFEKNQTIKKKNTKNQKI